MRRLYADLRGIIEREQMLRALADIYEEGHRGEDFDAWVQEMKDDDPGEMWRPNPKPQ